MSLITIEQLLESVDLHFEPRWVTKAEDGHICIWNSIKPEFEDGRWLGSVHIYCAKFKLAEFDGKDWTECIYEVPRKTTGKIEDLPVNVDWVDIKDQKVVLSNECMLNMYAKITTLIDAVNELKGAK